MERLVRVCNVCASEVRYIHWIPDRSTGLWYGSAFVQMSSLKEAERLVQEASTKCLKIGNSRLAEWYLAHDGRVFTCFSLSTYDSVGNMHCPSQDDSASILHLWETTTSGHPAAKNLSGRPSQSSQRVFERAVVEAGQLYRCRYVYTIIYLLVSW